MVPHARSFWAAAGFAAVVSLAGAAAQQPATPQSQPKTPAVESPQEARADFRARLERRLADSKALQERIQTALKRMDEGAPTEEVRGMVDPSDRGIRQTNPDRPFRMDGPPRAEGQARGDGPRGPRGPEGGPGRPPGPAPKMDSQAVLEFLDEHNPDAAKRMREALQENPAMAERLLGRLEPHIREALAEPDPQTRDLRIAQLRNGWEIMGATRTLTDAIRQETPQPKLDEIQGELRGLLAQYFDIQVKLREREIAGLEARLGQLRTEMATQLSRKGDFIGERLTQIVKAAQERRERGRSEDGPPGGKR